MTRPEQAASLRERGWELRDRAEKEPDELKRRRLRGRAAVLMQRAMELERRKRT